MVNKLIFVRTDQPRVWWRIGDDCWCRLWNATALFARWSLAKKKQDKTLAIIHSCNKYWQLFAYSSWRYNRRPNSCSSITKEENDCPFQEHAYKVQFYFKAIVWQTRFIGYLFFPVINKQWNSFYLKNSQCRRVSKYLSRVQVRRWT